MFSAVLVLGICFPVVFSWTSVNPSEGSVDLIPSRLIHSSVPRLNIKSRGFITRSSWNVLNLRAVHNLSSIEVSWNLTPTPADELSCCSTTFLEVYPMDYVERRRVKDEALRVVMVPFNTSTYQLDTALLRRKLRLKQTFRPKTTADEYVDLINSQRYVVCIRLWHRLAGKDRIVDESCTTSVISSPPSNEDPSTILIVFVVIISFNILLILTVVLIARYKKRQTDTEKSVLPFTVKKWWKDVSDVLHIQQRANMAAQDSLFGQVNGGLSVISSSSNTPSLLNSYVTDYASSRPSFCSPNVPRSTRIAGLTEGTLPHYYQLPGSHCYYNVFPRAAAIYPGQQYAVLDPLHHGTQGIDHRRAASWRGAGSGRGPVSMIV